MDKIYRYRRRLRVFHYFGLLILYLLILLFSYKHLFRQFLLKFSSYNDFDRNHTNFKSNISESVQKCLIPQLDPFHISVKHLITGQHEMHCENSFPSLFSSTLDSHVKPVVTMTEFKKLGIISCCYRHVKRLDDEDKRDDLFSYSFTCYPLSLENKTKIHWNHEFIVIWCDYSYKNFKSQTTQPEIFKTKVQDMHAFVHAKPQVEKKFRAFKPPSETRLNVAIFGLDSVSRMNFIRTMPQSYEYLMKKLQAVEMKGYNKIGDNTFPNIVPALTSLTAEKLTSTCEIGKKFDKCPFIWKNFSELGYRTAFAEDAPKVSIFNYLKLGFNQTPTDYYLRPFAVAAETYFERNRLNPCQGPRLGLENLLDYLKKLFYQMNLQKKSFFSFTWSTSLSHNYLNYPFLGDKYLKEALHWLDTSNHLNNTIMILMSDHGIRWGPIRELIQGQLEERLPFMYFILPVWFKKRYPRAYKNLKGNEDRLTTSLDLYYTLQNILHIESIETATLAETEEGLRNLEADFSLPLGISHFLPIPLSRTCRNTSIEDVYCVCNPFKQVSVNLPVIKKAANAIVIEINKRIERHPICASLRLKTIKMAQETHLAKADKKLGYLINLETLPGEGNFEALVSLNERTGSLKVSGSISRTNLYGNQSQCVHEKSIKYFCYCLA